MRKTFFFWFYLLAGIIAGSLIATACRGVPALSWLAYSASIGFSPANPAVIDLLILKLTFGFSMSISVAQIITVCIAMYIYHR